MRLLLLAGLLLAASPAPFPAWAQRPGPHDGLYQGQRFQECTRGGGRVAREQLSAEVRNNRISIPGLPGDPMLEGDIAADGKVNLPPFGLFGAGTGQIYEGLNNARRFTGTHPGRGDCRVSYELLRQRPVVR
jgi:hypothetical protein